VHPRYRGDGNFSHIPLADGALEPDGRPFILTKDDRSVCFLKEIDRRTEPLTATSKRPSIEGKLLQYREFMASKATGPPS
jgi:hypothetical protein